MGENGAGKSTLIKILTGIYPKRRRTDLLNGQPVEIRNRTDASKLGIGVIYQELSLIPTLTVMQNVMLGKEGRAGIINTEKDEEKVSELIQKYGFRDQTGCNWENTFQSLKDEPIEILKALSEDSKLIIMDEPTASLSTKGIRRIVSNY